MEQKTCQLKYSHISNTRKLKKSVHENIFEITYFLLLLYLTNEMVSVKLHIKKIDKYKRNNKLSFCLIMINKIT